MEQDRVLDIERAERALRSQLEAAYVASTVNSHQLHECVTTLTGLLRNAGMPPERVLIAVKHAAFPGGIFPSLSTRPGSENVEMRQVIERMVRWCIEAYFFPTDSVLEGESAMPIVPPAGPSS